MEAITRKLRPRRASEASGRKLSSTLASNDSLLSSSETDDPFDSKIADQARKKNFMVPYI